MIITFDPPENVGGVEGRAIGYTKELLKIGQHVVVVAFAHDYDFSTERFWGAYEHKYPSSYRKFAPSLRRLQGLAISESIDSVFMLSGALTLLGAMMLLSCRIRRKKSAIFLYGKDILQSKKSFSGRFLLRISMALANRVVTNSRYTSTLLPSSRARAAVLYPSVDPSVAEGSETQSGQEDSRLLFVGRLIRRKGVSDLLDAFVELVIDIPEARLEIVGDGPERRSLEQLAADLGLDKRVSFLGTLRGEALYERYRQSHIFVMPSKTLSDDVEGFGTVFLEAALFGKPSVGTFSGGIPEAVLDGVTGILVEEGNVPELASALRTLMTQPVLARSLGEKARKRTLKEFTWQVGTDRLLMILRGQG